MAEQRWIPVTERLPETRTDVLVCDSDTRRGGLYGFITVASLSIDGKFWFDASGDYDRPMEAVTHWMKLPEPPEAK